MGLTSKELRDYVDLVTKANTEQVIAMAQFADREVDKRRRLVFLPRIERYKTGVDKNV